MSNTTAGYGFNKSKPFTVSQITRYIKDIIDEDVLLSDILVAGEISNLKFHSSGHLYFTLKDSGAAISVVMFKNGFYGGARELTFTPEDGMTVVCRGRASVYEKTGRYQLYAESMEPFGKGDLHAEFERLKGRLSAEGLFDASHKRSIPKYARGVAVVTSPTGAAVRDIIDIIRRRSRSARIFISPAAVQGENAAKSIADAIKLANEWGRADVLIVGRGGGSAEDLSAFNEEIVARAIYESKIPVISAVGHETDFTLAAFTAVLRAPTPSAAAELAVPDMRETEYKLLAYKNALEYGIDRILTGAKQKTDEYIYGLNRAFDRKLTDAKIAAVNLEARLNALSPYNVLSRGYAVVSGVNGETVSAKDLKTGEEIIITFKDGEVKAAVSE